MSGTGIKLDEAALGCAMNALAAMMEQGARLPAVLSTIGFDPVYLEEFATEAAPSLAGDWIEAHRGDEHGEVELRDDDADALVGYAYGWGIALGALTMHHGLGHPAPDELSRGQMTDEEVDRAITAVTSAIAAGWAARQADPTANPAPDVRAAFREHTGIGAPS